MMEKDIIPKKLIEKLKNEKIPIVIFGAGIVGKILNYFCEQENIKIECFCDNNITKTKSLLCDKPVMCASQIKEKYRNVIFLISVADIKDVIEQINNMGYSNWYSGGLILKDINISELLNGEPFDYSEYAVTTCILCHYYYLQSDYLFLRSLDVIITERCSLRCKDCSNLMQYYQKPKDCNLDLIFSSLDILFNNIDEINECRVIGGEPFMNKQWNLVVEKLIHEPKVKNIIIYTNATIIPDEKLIDCLKNTKTLIFITDYGLLSKNIDGLIELLERNGIAYYVNKVEGWTECSSILKHNRGLEEQKNIFNNCCAKNLFTLSEGKLFRCPFSANINRLLAAPNYMQDYINLFEVSKGYDTIDIIKSKIREYLFDLQYLEVCDYCSGRTLSDPQIQPALQTNKPIKYKKFK